MISWLIFLFAAMYCGYWGLVAFAIGVEIVLTGTVALYNLRHYGTIWHRL